MADIVRECESFRQVFIQAERYRNRARYLGYLNGVGEAVAEVVVETGREDLCLVFQPPECARVDDPVAIALEVVAVWVGEFGITPALRTLDRKSKVGQRGPAHVTSLLGRNLAESSDGGAANRDHAPQRSGSSSLRASAGFFGAMTFARAIVACSFETRTVGSSTTERRSFSASACRPVDA